MRLILTSICVFLTMTCLVSMMAVFLGAQSPMLGSVLIIQAALAPLIFGIFVLYTWLSIRRIGFSKLLTCYRRSVRGWMWFIFWSINSLVIAGELSFWIVQWASDKRPPLLEHAPLWSAAASTFAVLSMFIWGRIRERKADPS